LVGDIAFAISERAEFVIHHPFGGVHLLEDVDGVFKTDYGMGHGHGNALDLLAFDAAL
jgi:hypothetical protein